MDRQNAIEYITKGDWRQSRLGLERISELMERLGNPQDKLRFVHVAGTNGKGSTCSMLAGMLAAAGYTAGLFTSPYINYFNERMQVNGRDITDGDVARLTEKVRAHADKMADPPSEFELICAIGFLWFCEQGCDIVVLEVGLGGRLDATNVIAAPLLAVITTIDLDHTEQLGNTLPQIAAEKAGIIKEGSTVLLYPQPPEVEAVVAAACRRQGATLVLADFAGLVPGSHNLLGQTFSYGRFEKLSLRLLGAYQLNNAAMAITAAGLLGEKGFPIPDEAVRRGLAGVHWPARFEVVHTAPPVIVDGGHNPQCVQELVRSLEMYFPGQKLVFVAGVMADKDYETMFRLVLPLAEQVFCVTPDNPRALPAEKLADFFRAAGFERVAACETVAAGVAAAMRAAGADTPVCAFGSFYMAGDVRACFTAEG